MKKVLLLLSCSLYLTGYGQSMLESRKYSWIAPAKKDNENLLSQVLMEGAAQDMSQIKMEAVVLPPFSNAVSLAASERMEQLLLVTKGSLKLAMRDSTWTLGKGSIALIMPDDPYKIENKENDTCGFFLMKYRSKSEPDPERGRSAGGSIVRIFDDLVFKPHDKGGIRNYFERPTTMCKRFEMHVTTLNEGIKSHDPHTHRAEEIVLILENKTEMQIGDKFYKAGPGDFYFLGSNVLHAIQNVGVGQCVYFAFQFE